MLSIIGCGDDLVGTALSGELNMFVIMALSCFGMISVCLLCGTIFLVDLVHYLQKMLFLSSSCFDHSFLNRSSMVSF